MMKRQGFTLVELLIALAILGILLGIASNAIVQYLGIQSDQEAQTSVQARLRRTSEIVSQELRGAILGAVTGLPYTSGANQISVALLDGSAGYPVSQMTTTSTRIISTASSAADVGLSANDYVLIVGSDNQAVMKKVNTVSAPASSVVTLSHSNCAAAALNNPLLFKVRTLGYRYDRANRRLLAREGNNAETAVAFNISSFSIDYIYTSTAGVVLPDASEPSPPARSATVGGTNYTLDRLEVTIAGEERSRGKTISRTYANQIDLVDNTRLINVAMSYSIQGVTICP
jgi:prepilin-type N-terminal cleavage/methylation domain-containing protein